MVNAAYLALVYFMVSVPSLLVNFHSQDQTADFAKAAAKPEYAINQTEEFDYIVVGAGAAGSVIASRLSASGRSVLVLERGSTPSPLSFVPTMWLPIAYVDSASIKRYPTVPQVGLGNRVINLIAGNVLGGGSAINAMLFIRGSPSVYDEWAQITGDRSWSWNSVLPYFKRLENYNGVWSDGGTSVDRSVHGVGGPLHIEATNQIQPSSQVFFDAVREAGLSIHDLNANLTEGFQPADMNIKLGKRQSTYTAFLEPVLAQRKNLRVYPYSTATKIHLDSFKRAYGVTYIRHGQTRFARARREVIVSAGAIESPKLLLLSGIGPRDELAALGIEPKVNLPVGQNLEDHASLAITFKFNQPITFVPERDMNAQTQVEYMTSGYGPIHNDVATYGYITSPQYNQPNFPDLQFFINHQTAPGSDPVAAATVVRPDTNAASIFLVRPESTGSIRLSSADPSAPLTVDAGLGAIPSDIQRLVEGVKWVVRIYENSTTYGNVGGASLIQEQLPPSCAVYEFRSDEYWACVVRALTISGFHYAGTCRMGKEFRDSKAVVDSKLRVIGTRSLRVADASVMPLVPNANTNAASIMIGERASDLVIFGI